MRARDFKDEEMERQKKKKQKEKMKREKYIDSEEADELKDYMEIYPIKNIKRWELEE